MNNQIDLQAIAKRYLAVQMRFASLSGQAKTLRAQQEKLAGGIRLAKARLEMAPQIAEVFEYLQEKAHARAVGEFEDLLSAFVADVIPEAGKVRLELGTERGAPALDILLDNEGDLEDILDGNGGGLTNVVVTGLTYAAQARTRTRPLVVLDEPDCWLKATRVPAFTRVIAEVADAGCQTLMISHNDASLIDDAAHILLLTHDKEGLPAVASLSGFKSWSDEEQVGLRWIEVENLRRHAKTRIPLSPGLNVLAGDVNGGKSTLFISALRAIAYGESDDTMIRHHQDMTTVRVGIERNVVLEMTRKRKGAPKVLFRRYENGVMTNEGRQESRGGVPDFIADALKIERVDGLDIQLRSQKTPVFLLNESPARRAQLLSVGKESGLLQALTERHRNAQKRDRELLRRDETELNRVNCQLKALAPLSGLASLADIITALQADAQTARDNLNKLAALVGRIEKLTPAALLCKPAQVMLSHVPAAPVLHNITPLAAVIQRVAQNQDIARLPAPPAAPQIPSQHETSSLARLIASVERNSAAAKLARHAAALAAPAAPAAVDHSPLLRLINKLQTAANQAQTKEKEAKAADAMVIEAERSVRELKLELGTCPLCERAFDGHSHTEV